MSDKRVDRPSTWKLDQVWRAACWRRRADEAERLLGKALDARAGDTVIRALLNEVEGLRNKTRRAALGYAITEVDKETMKWRRRHGDRYGCPLSAVEAASLAVVEAEDDKRGHRAFVTPARERAHVS